MVTVVTLSSGHVSPEGPPPRRAPSAPGSSGLPVYVRHDLEELCDKGEPLAGTRRSCSSVYKTRLTQCGGSVKLFPAFSKHHTMSSSHRDSKYPSVAHNSHAPSTNATQHSNTSSDTLATLEPTHAFPPSHAPGSPDLSYPFATTNLPPGISDEYREVAESGFVHAGAELMRAATRVPTRDPEMAKHMKDMNIVVFKPNDPEDPRTWNTTYRWCMFLFSSTLLTLYSF